MEKDTSENNVQPQAREGLFDAQLTFSVPHAEGPQPIQNVVKRNGRIEPFDKAKIASSIFRAAQSIGGTDFDRAVNLASGVAIFLGKELKGQPPTADQIDDAVEKVLIEMGHARTALTYARFRDRRARVRRFSQGDTRSLLNELAEARKARELAPVSPSSLFVRTSSEKLAGWDCGRIVDALVRETGLDEGMANVIAIEVEQQIFLSNAKTLTAPLVRELVNAKLIEHGLNQHLRRHMRLGVPLYDTERIICGPDIGGKAGNPEATGFVLAESVKREYALSQVFSEEVAEAHLRGEIAINHLGQVDRLVSADHSLEVVTRFGTGLPGSMTFSKPPKYADTLLAQMVNYSSLLRAHFSGPSTWRAVNTFFGPFLKTFDARALRQLAQMLVFEYAYRTSTHGENPAAVNLDLYWETPAGLRKAEAVQPGGSGGSAVYGDYVFSAQAFALSLLDVLIEGGSGNVSFPAPTPVVRITPPVFKMEGHENFLERVAELAARRGNVHMVFDRGGAQTPELPGESWQSDNLVMHEVVLNLPRLAYGCMRSAAAATEHDLLYALARTVEVAAKAHCQKRDFVEKVLKMGSLGPLALFVREYDGAPCFHLDRGVYRVGMTGLNECVQAMTGLQMHQSEQALKLGMRIIRHICGLCRHWSELLDIRLEAASAHVPEIDRRFAMLDLDAFSCVAEKMVKNDLRTQTLYYTSGIGLHVPAEMSPFEHIRMEGVLHGCLPHGAASVVVLPDAETSRRSIIDFIQKTYHSTACSRIEIHLHD